MISGPGAGRPSISKDKLWPLRQLPDAIPPTVPAKPGWPLTPALRTVQAWLLGGSSIAHLLAKRRNFRHGFDHISWTISRCRCLAPMPISNAVTPAAYTRSGPPSTKTPHETWLRRWTMALRCGRRGWFCLAVPSLNGLLPSRNRRAAARNPWSRPLTLNRQRDPEPGLMAFP